MPSRPDPRWPDDEELLQHVVRRGTALRRRRRVLRATTAAVAVTALAMVPATLLSRGGHDQARRLATTQGADASTTTSEETTTTTTVEETTTTTAAPAVETTVPHPTTTTTAPTTTTTSCYESYDPACGPFHWDPPPGPDQPATLTVTYSPAHPHVGQTITFPLTYTDPDSQPELTLDGGDWGDGDMWAAEPSVVNCPNLRARYGPWPTPPRQGGTAQGEAPTYGYAKSGTYTVTVRASGRHSCEEEPNPYEGDAVGSVTVTVEP